jgi:Ion channel
MTNKEVEENKISKVMNFWNEDRSLTVMLLLLLLFIFIFVPSLSRGRIGEVFIKITYSVMLLTGILSVARHKKYVIFVSIFAVIGLIANWLSDAEPSRPILIVHDIAAIFFNTFFALAILIKTFKPGDITFHRIEGSIVVFLLVGLIFSYVFHAVYLFTGDSSFNNINGNGLREFLYFSFTSLTTMGYGDITPVHPLARSLANFEALIGQLYPAILIARLVSMEFESSNKKREMN